jgi:hypothetical protein
VDSVRRTCAVRLIASSVQYGAFYLCVKLSFRPLNWLSACVGVAMARHVAATGGRLVLPAVPCLMAACSSSGSEGTLSECLPWGFGTQLMCRVAPAVCGWGTALRASSVRADGCHGLSHSALRGPPLCFLVCERRGNKGHCINSGTQGARATRCLVLGGAGWLAAQGRFNFRDWAPSSDL